MHMSRAYTNTYTLRFNMELLGNRGYMIIWLYLLVQFVGIRMKPSLISMFVTRTKVSLFPFLFH